MNGVRRPERRSSPNSTAHAKALTGRRAAGYDAVQRKAMRFFFDMRVPDVAVLSGQTPVFVVLGSSASNPVTVAVN